ncbi:hypothetical protein MTF65_03060 [Streptomyces sp. APSN-46.1]|uniref:hypothetical protein n=1 Tax=Streptomyces sp. APSN-46.1 TaxID=2929049 RepID=UPI001FB2144E|nr:hypothetical protein [Streptomyces sp. APSN-46.1]MCJ1676348.1 hypothetical protein [Streptomyces sp. APSN-46.1]
MVTARSSSGTLRTRSSAGSLRVLWVAMLLFTFLYTHGASTEAVTGHINATAAAPVAVAVAHAHAADDAPLDHRHHGGGHGTSHPAEQCVPGQPQQSPTVDAPEVCALVHERTSTVALTSVGFRDAAPVGSSLSAASARATVLQI